MLQRVQRREYVLLVSMTTRATRSVKPFKTALRSMLVDVPPDPTPRAVEVSAAPHTHIADASHGP
jgi:hypothetical protein